MIEWIITSSVMIIAIVALRFILKGKISLRLQYMLWAVVLVRLLFPFNIVSSNISIMNFVDEAKERLEWQKTKETVIETDSLEMPDYQAELESFINYNNTYEKTRKDYELPVVHGVVKELRPTENAPIIENTKKVNEPEKKPEFIDIVSYLKARIMYAWIAGIVLAGMWFMKAIDIGRRQP